MISALEYFSTAVWVRFADLAVGELAHANAIWVEDIFLAVCKLDGFDTRLLYLLDSAIGEDALFLSVLENALDRAIRESKTKE